MRSTNTGRGVSAIKPQRYGHPVDYMGGGTESIVSDKTQYAVRRLTPLECERLQGLPDDYTLIDDKSCSDSARYKALGNGMAQPCADFIIRRIVEEVENEN